MELNSNKLLIVDNDPMARRYTRHLAIKLDYDVEECQSVSEALELIKESSPSLIVIDLNLPDTDGIGMLAELAKLDCKAAILILGSFERAILDTAETVGKDLGLRILGVMTKPVITAELASWLKLARVGQPVVSEQVLRSALDNGEFLLHYQPTFCRTGDHPWHATSVAAYIRWNHPEFGILKPGQFLGEVEKAGLLPELTDQAILEAMRQIHYWQERGVSVTVGVSIPWHLITDSEVPERLEALAREVDINPGKMILNISDIKDSENSSVGREVLARLRLKGFQLAFDGFTDLRSSIISLVKLPFTAVNLDSSLPSLASCDKDVAGSVAAIVSVAQELGLEVHAKSVADQRELDTVENLGCHSARGNLFCHALPGSEVEGFVRQWNKAAVRPRLELASTIIQLGNPGQ